MRCPSCEAPNAPGRRFCGRCGRSLANRCPECGFANEPDERFCGGCGSRLEPSAAKATTPMTAWAGGERRQLTVLFCDLVDSTRLGQTFDPEELQRLLQGLRQICTDCVQRFGGVVTQFLGDGILACFGYPTAHEDDAQRAVRAAVALREQVASRRAHETLPLEVRIGIATGLVVTADSAGREALLTMVGDPLAMASRLQALAPPDGIVLAPLTRELVGDLFEYEDLGQHRLKGFVAPVQAWRVLRERRGVDRFGLRHGLAGLSAFVGREREQAVLSDVWQRVRAGSGRAVVISGEPGIGKSRSVARFISSLERESHVRVRYFCLPYFQDTPFHPAIEHLERIAGIAPTQLPAERRARLELVLREFANCDAEAVSLCAEVMGFAEGGEASRDAALAAAQRERFHALLLDLLRGVARRAPVIMIVEDAHWLDPSTNDFLDRVVDILPDLPVLLLVTTRPEFVPAWLDAPHVIALPLNRLDRDCVLELVRSMAGATPLSDALIDEIAAKSDGVPLFVEELVRHVLARAADGAEPGAGPGAVPDTLRDLLMARLDGLGLARTVAQAAAVVGRRFRLDLLAAVLGSPTQALGDAIACLREAGLIVVHGDPPEGMCLFRHALIQEVARDNLLRRDRQALHLRVGEVLERDFPELAARHPEVVAMHFCEAGRPERAAVWQLAAGDQALSRYARAEARRHYQAAYAATVGEPGSAERDALHIRALLALAAVAGNRTEVLADLDRIEAAQWLSPDAATRARLRYWSARLRYVLGEFGEAVRLAGESLSLVREAGLDEAFAADPINLLARLACLRGRAGEAVAHATDNIRQMRALSNRSEEAAMTGVLAFGLALHGRFDEAMTAADRSLELARALGHLPTLAAAHCYRGVLSAWRGDVRLFVADFAATLELADRSGDLFRRYLAHGWRGQGYLVAGNPQLAMQDLEAALALAERLGTTFHLGAFQAFYGQVELLADCRDAARRRAQEAVAIAEAAGQEWSLSIALRVQSEILLAHGPGVEDAALHAIERALAIQADCECHYDLAWSHLAYGRVLDRRGNRKEADAALARAATLFAGMGVRCGVAAVRQAQAQLH
jgi:class 3 adenylate cyclase/tetratricopeptide (TPR) repeat protein